MKRTLLSLSICLLYQATTQAQSAAIYLCNDCTYVDKAHNKSITFNRDGSVFMDNELAAGYSCRNIDGTVNLSHNGKEVNRYRFNHNGSLDKCTLVDQKGNCYQLQGCKPAQENPPSPTTASTRTSTMSDNGIDGVTVGMSIAAVKAKYPSLRRTEEEGVGELYFVADGRGKERLIMRQENGRVSELMTNSPMFKTSEGFGVGTMFGVLKAKYHVIKVSDLNEESLAFDDLTIQVEEYPHLEFDLVVDQEIWSKARNGKILASEIPASTRVEYIRYR